MKPSLPERRIGGRSLPGLLATAATLALALGGCSGGDELDPGGSEDPAADAGGSAVDAAEAAEGGGGDPVGPDSSEPTPSPIREAPSTTWPRPVPPSAGYAEEAVPDPGSIQGTVTAATEGRASAFEAEEADGCPGPPPTYPAGPVAGAVVRLQGIAAGAPRVERAATATLGACAVSPRIQLASLDSVLRIAAEDEHAHDVRLIEADGYRNLGGFTVSAEGEIERRLRVPGLLHLRCETHPGARGWIWVTEHPYAVLTDPDGTFGLGGIPAGHYVLHVWHEAFSSAMQEIDLTAGEAQVTDFILRP